MNTFAYWILFGLLVSLFVIFLSWIILNFFLDYCLQQSEGDGDEWRNNNSDKYDEAEEARRLNKYLFDRHDVEDLTRMQGDFKKVLPNVSFTNEVADDGNIGRLLKIQENATAHDAMGSSLSNIDEEDGSKYSSDDIHPNVAGGIKHNNYFKSKKQISQSVDDLEFCDPRGIDGLKVINKIEEEARKVEKELHHFIGGVNNVRFYELNEKFLRLMIALCDVKCVTSDLQKRKTETLEYIEECKRKLKERAVSML